MRKTVFAVLVVLLIAAVGYYMVAGPRGSDAAMEGVRVEAPTPAADSVPAAAPPTPAAAKNDLPELPLLRSDGTRTTARNLTGKVILVFYLPDCNHCQREARQISNNLNYFKDYSLHFVSTAPLPEQERFGKEYNLAGQPNVSFAQTTPEELYKHYGLFPTPTVYIYQEGGRLVKIFRDETPVEQIIAALGNG
ncbi:MAG: redoxin domain-containing protein [Cytophagales bacterium]|nr:redoxin domain-containing protein [Cytophagales bacterium]